MGYMHIENLYRCSTILEFKRCFALEKIHGTSAHITWAQGANARLAFSPGGESHDRFVSLFDQDALRVAFQEIGYPSVTVYGEAYGGKQQRQAWRYGPDLKFVAFEVKIGDTWLAVPNAADVARKLGLEFVHYVEINAVVDEIDAERDAPSEQARRNGVEGDQPREGVVLRPVFEVTLSSGSRVIAKHKRDEERETKTPRKVGVAPEVLIKAESIAMEWVTPTRLQHVLDKLPPGIGMEATRDVISAMTEDVLREGEGEFVDGKEVRKAIGTMAVKLFKKHLKNSLKG